MELNQILAELESFGSENDRLHTEYTRRMMNIPRETGKFLQVLVIASRAQRILELGTSNGYSTLWLARAARAAGGCVTTVDKSDFKFGLARANFERAGMRDVITQVQGNARDFLARAANASFDFIFLDSARTEYPDWWPDIKRVLAAGGMWIADNALSHAQELQPLVSLVEADPDFTTCLVPMGNGEYVAVKS